MRVLVACEESQRVCIAFRERGHEAFSCDIQPPSGGHPEWHLQGDALVAAYGGGWDLMIAHPPCTYLTVSGNRWFSLRCVTPEQAVERWDKRAQAAVFFMQLMLAPVPRIAVENPIGYMSRAYRPADQIISPWQFVTDEDDPEYVGKKTCLWLKGLEPLKRTGNLKDPAGRWGKYNGKGKNRTWADQVRTAKERAKTFYCIAAAMAEQWG